MGCHCLLCKYPRNPKTNPSCVPLWKEEGTEREYFIKVIHLIIPSSSDLSCCHSTAILDHCSPIRPNPGWPERKMQTRRSWEVPWVLSQEQEFPLEDTEGASRNLQKKASVIRNFNLQSWGKGVGKLNQRGISRPGSLWGNCMPHPTADEA